VFRAQDLPEAWVHAGWFSKAHAREFRRVQAWTVGCKQHRAPTVLPPAHTPSSARRGTIDRLLPPATRLGKYELISHVAIGGMAEIYVARASGIAGFEKAVILKRILPQHAADPEFVQMFLDEARLAATLHHANVVQVFDIGVEGDSPFFTMERVHGEHLGEILRAAHRAGRGLSLEHALAIVAGAAAGLHHAHEQGIVHRDVSPSNVMVTFDGVVKVVDFGIAKAAARRTSTRDGTIKGKVSYMSPEQCRGDALDRRSDVFALGILLFELTTGRRLFKGDEYAVLQAVIHTDAPAPSSVKDDYPPALERIVVRALQRDPANRHATAEELQVELEELARDQRWSLSSVGLGRFLREIFPDRPDRTPVPRPLVPTKLTSVETPARTARTRRSRPGLAIAGAALLVGVALLTWRLWPGDSRAAVQGTARPDAAVHRTDPAVQRTDAAVQHTDPPDAAVHRTDPDAVDAGRTPAGKRGGSVRIPDAGVPVDAAPAPIDAAPPPPPDATPKTKRPPLFGRDAAP
jgi:serine/threonine protein kinase